MMVTADEILQEFLADSWENLSQLDQAMATLEQEPASAPLLAQIFRTVHTIKGTCGYLELRGLGSVAHAAENVLGKMREGRLDVNSSALAIVREGVDRIKELLQGLEATGEEPRLDSDRVIRKMNLLASLADRVPQKATDTLAPVSRNKPDASTSIDTHGTRPAGLIRVPVEMLDNLMNLVGELVLARNQLLPLIRSDDESRYAGPLTQMNRITSELQQGLMKTRMQPIGNSWNKLSRLVRDLSRVTGKPMELELHGGETEIDRTVLEAVRDPLMHMIRNSADHGIEAPAERRALGKPEIGRLRLSASQEQGDIIISLEDDGAGINRERVIRQALNQGLITEADAECLSDEEIIQIIFRPGFSTAVQVSSVSGRGVGMDVVRTEIERVGGTVAVTSLPGNGTTVCIRIPLSMAIISALLIENNGEIFAIPQSGVVEQLRLTAEERQSLSSDQSQEVFRFRDRLLPLIPLQSVLNSESQPIQRDDIEIVVVQVGEEQLGLAVESILGTEKLIIRPAIGTRREIPGTRETTMLDDGRPVTILDLAAIAEQFGRLPTLPEPEEIADSPIKLTRLLRFTTSSGNVMAVPLADVSHIEEILTENLERSGEQFAMTYQGRRLSLVSIDDDLTALLTRRRQTVMIFAEEVPAFGLLVPQIQDTVEEGLMQQLASPRPGILGTADIVGQATEILDISHYRIQAAANKLPIPAAAPPKKVLVIDDSMFFRQLIRTALEAISYRVTTADGAERAVDLITHGERFDAILCDIEMPGMDGCQFAAWCRQYPTVMSLPLVAITSLDSDVHGPRIMHAGFDRLLVKFHPQQLRDTLAELLMPVAEVPLGLSA